MILKDIILNLINAKIRNNPAEIEPEDHATVEEQILDAIFIPYQVIEMDCTLEFIQNNFIWDEVPEKGLGKNLMVGFAYCNGNNGTRDRRKLTSVCYSDEEGPFIYDYGEMGNEFGSESHVLTKEELPSTIDIDTSAGTDEGNDYMTTGRQNEGRITLQTGGLDKAHNNMQPSIVSFFVQRV
ncbi:hypothetical protein KBJ98_01995 [Flavobacterium sp. F-328]|uniref:Tail fiber protein n=1 Tax=Flavobacterium erciyesense TaxID=2825842 RepID=A0ABS5D0D3_9FLAO|nr:hypothetical protein [Flavobacterium erciyesense]MBQ0907467.1 hypothetical protein [Flavobacterium erciyesense]